MKARSAVLVAILLAGPAVNAQPSRPGRKVAPVDEAQHDPELARLRAGLLDAAGRADLTRLLPFLAEPVVVFSTNRSHSELRRWFAAQSPSDQARFWERVRDAFTLGMAYERGANAPMLLAPYTGVALSEIPNTLSDHYAVVGSGVAVYRDPTVSSPVIERLDHDVVDAVVTSKAPPGPADVLPRADQWRQVRTPSGQLGWLPSTHARSAYDTRFSIERIDGVWKVTGWATGE